MSNADKIALAAKVIEALRAENELLRTAIAETCRRAERGNPCCRHTARQAHVVQLALEAEAMDAKARKEGCL